MTENVALFPLNSKQPEHFFERLRQLRTVRGMSQAEVARETGLQPSSIAHFESGSRLPSFENLRLLSVALRCSADYLLGISNSPAESFGDPLVKSFHALSAQDREYVALFVDVLASRTPFSVLKTPD